MALDQGVLDAVTNSNFKTIAEAAQVANRLAGCALRALRLNH